MEAHLTVEGHPSTCPSLLRQDDSDLGGLGEDDGTEGKGVGADRRQSHDI